MSRKNHKNHAATTGTDNRHLLAVAEDPGQQGTQTTEDKVRVALAAAPDPTTAALAITAGVGRSTAAKVLAHRGRDGTAIRTAGDGPRNPDTEDANAMPSTDNPAERTSATDDGTTQGPADVAGYRHRPRQHDH